MKIINMKNYKDLEIYRKSFDLAILIHKLSLKLPTYEQFELASQIRRSAQSTRSNIVEGYGRREYKPEFIRFLIFSQSSCDETISHLDMLIKIYPLILEDRNLNEEYEILCKMINNFIKYVRNNWKTGKS